MEMGRKRARKGENENFGFAYLEPPSWKKKLEMSRKNFFFFFLVNKDNSN